MSFNPMGMFPMPFPPQMTPNMPMFPQSPAQAQTPINPAQFKQILPQLNDSVLEQLAAQARQSGISEEDIQSGLNFIKQMR